MILFSRVSRLCFPCTEVCACLFFFARQQRCSVLIMRHTYVHITAVLEANLERWKCSKVLAKYVAFSISQQPRDCGREIRLWLKGEVTGDVDGVVD